MTALEGGVGALGDRERAGRADDRAAEPRRERRPHRRRRASLYGGTYNQLHYTFPKLGVEVSFIDDPDDLDAWTAAIRPNTKAFYGESIGNPKGDILDFEGVADGRARQRHPARHRQHARDRRTSCQPLQHGADIVVHSATKFIGGHGTSIGGIIVDGGKFDYVGQRPLPELHRARPELPRPRVLAAARAAAARAVHPQGAAAVPARHRRRRSSPFNSFLFLQGLETLSLRMERHSQNALAVAQWLEARDEVEWVAYPGLKSSQWNERAKKYLPQRAGRDRRVRHQGRPRGRARASSTASSCSATSPTSATCAASRSTPRRTTHSSSTPSEQATTGRDARPRAAVGRHRDARRHPRRPRRRVPRRQGRA